MTLAAYMHRLSPFLVEFSPGVGVRWYGLSYIAGFLAAFALMKLMARRGRALVPPEKCFDLIVAIALGTVVGGRLGYVILYKPAMFISFTDVTLFGVKFPMWEPLALNQGGMASHGGIIGIILACCWFARKNGIPKLHILDLAAFTGLLGVAFGRIANFINGELYGRPAPADHPFAVRFPHEASDWFANYRDSLDPTKSVDPAVAQESLDKLHALSDVAPKLGDLAVSPEQWAAWVQQFPVSETARYMIGDRIDHMVHATRGRSFTGDQIAAALESILAPRHPSQLYQAALEGLLLMAILALVWIKPRRPGVIAGCFLIGYAVMRTLGEQFRTPDQHLGYQALGLTRGQWLSVGVLAAGIVLTWYWSRRDADKVGGWMR